MRHPNGFTLLEVLMALFIAAVTFVAFFVGVSQMMGNQASMIKQTQATWVASQVMAFQSSQLNQYEPFNVTSGTTVMGKTEYFWEVETVATEDADVAKVDVHVYDGNQPLLSLTGYRNNS